MTLLPELPGQCGVAALVAVWPLVPVDALPEPALTPLHVGPLAEPADREGVG